MNYLFSINQDLLFINQLVAWDFFLKVWKSLALWVRPWGANSYAMVLTTADPQSKQPGLMCCVHWFQNTRTKLRLSSRWCFSKKPFIITLSLIWTHFLALNTLHIRHHSHEADRPILNGKSCSLLKTKTLVHCYWIEYMEGEKAPQEERREGTP